MQKQNDEKTADDLLAEFLGKTETPTDEARRLEYQRAHEKAEHEIDTWVRELVKSGHRQLDAKHSQKSVKGQLAGDASIDGFRIELNYPKKSQLTVEGTGWNEVRFGDIAWLRLGLSKPRDVVFQGEEESKPWAESTFKEIVVRWLKLR